MENESLGKGVISDEIHHRNCSGRNKKQEMVSPVRV